VTREGYDFSNTRKSTKPKFFVQGEADDICPIQDMWTFYAALPEPKELVVIDAARPSLRRPHDGGRRGARDLLGDFNG
jgi:dipeptidyl aminopeptidase/acylaminoacyl peptidase